MKDLKIKDFNISQSIFIDFLSYHNYENKKYKFNGNW